MMHLLKRATFALVPIAIGILMVGISTSKAATGPWTWADTSSQLSVRAGRPVWATARGTNYWYLTDGLDLTKGGHVWRTEGSVMGDVTAQVRGAGLTRVDDIVSDGDTVLFLKNIVAGNTAFEVASILGDAATNRSTSWHRTIAKDEGIASVTGKDGVFTIVTTKGRLVQWNGRNDSATVLPDVPGASQFRTWNGNLMYSIRKTSPRDGTGSFQLVTVPVANGLLVAVEDPTAASASMRFYRYQNGTYTDVTSQLSAFGVKRLYTIASNGTSAMFVGSNMPDGAANLAFVYDGATLSNVSIWNIPTIDWSQAIVASNGVSWMILSGKDMYRFDGKNFLNLGPTRDYFVTVSGDAHGHFLVGGAISSAILAVPSYPMSAKLATVIETPSNLSDAATSPATGTTFWTWIEPSQTTLASNQTVDYHAGTWNKDGIKRMEVFLNGNLRQTCDFGTAAKGNQNCAYKLVGSAYAADSKLELVTKVTDAHGQTTWTGANSITRTGAALATNQNSADVQAWTWLEPNVSTLNKNEDVLLRAQGTSADGLNRIAAYVNGNLIQMCDFMRAFGTQACDSTISGTKYAVGTTLKLEVIAIGQDGKTTWSQVRNVDIVDNFKDAGAHPSVITTWMSPNLNLLQPADSINYFAQAQDVDGLDRIEMSVDGQPARTCKAVSLYSTNECSIPLSPKLYPDKSAVNVAVRVVDAGGFVTNADTRAFTLVH